MKKIILLSTILFSAFLINAQRIQRVTIGGNGSSLNFGLVLPQNVVIHIDQNGALGEWGVDKYADRQMNNNIQKPLDKFTV